ncbi:MAG: TldD/PmbA family protein [Mariprofundaceae bacterium]|nr:TldD/PmbA family protein [Mariprofundaceae bacterium]
MNLRDKTTQLLDMIEQQGAKHADAIAVNSVGESIHVRHGKVESIEAEHAQGIGLRGFVETQHGLAFASASTSDLSEKGLQTLAKQVVDMANISEPDPDVVPPVNANHPSAHALQTWANQHPKTAHGWHSQAAQDAALACEEAALYQQKDIQNSEGATAGFGDSHKVYAASDGFIAENHKSSASLSVSVIAGQDEKMQRDYAWHSAFLARDLRDANSLGLEAANRASSRLGSKSISSRNCPVVFEPRIATSILGHLISAINGRAILQKRSFLLDAVGEKLFPDFIHLSEDPNHIDGMANRLFDGEGTICQAKNIIEAGKLTTFLTDRYAAKRLQHPATGNASRGLTGDIGIGTANLILQAGSMSPQDIYHDIQDGFLVTELMGFGINGVTGDYSRGAAGFLIENGRITQPVQGITIASNLKDMFNNISHVGNDLTWLGSTATPSITISNMTIAGQ